MQFKKTEELKTGMRLARPIYNKNGVLLYERDSKLTPQSIASIKNFGLIGIYILEPAEPVPPMTEEDIEFERFQTINIFAIMDEIEGIINTGKSGKLQSLVANIIKAYGYMDRKINFIQNIRSREDYLYKHALNVAILCAMASHQLHIKVSERHDVVTAALLFGMKNYELIDKICPANPNVRRFAQQSDKILEGVENETTDPSFKPLDGAKILAMARVFDNRTAMNMEKTPESEVSTIKYMLDRAEYFSKDAVMALVNSVNLLNPGVCVELSTGEKALVLAENTNDIFRPMVLVFSDNTIIDLSNKFMYGDVEITDIMKTMDNRHVMDAEMLKKYGF